MLSKTPVGLLHEIKISLILKGDNVSRIRDKLTRTNAEHVWHYRKAKGWIKRRGIHTRDHREGTEVPGGERGGGARVEVTREQNNRGRRGATRTCTEDTKKESGGRAEGTVCVVWECDTCFLIRSRIFPPRQFLFCFFPEKPNIIISQLLRAHSQKFLKLAKSSNRWGPHSRPRHNPRHIGPQHIVILASC
jgi:hypothetical protein